MKAPTWISRGRRGRDWPKHAVIAFFICLELFPLYMMLQVSLKDNAAFLQDPWLPGAPGSWQWGNWVVAFRLVLPYLANTFVVAVTGTVGSLFCAVLGAYFFARYRLPLAGLLWSAFLVLMLLPTVANIVPLFSLLKGLSLLNSLWALIAVGVAGTQVFNLFVLRNFIEDLPRDLFEAAEMDGASHFQQIVNVVLPLAAPILGTLAILAFLGLWNEFLLPFIVLRDKELFTLGVGLIYLDGEYVKPWGQIMAAYLISSLPLILLFLCSMRLFVRGLSQGALKG